MEAKIYNFDGELFFNSNYGTMKQNVKNYDFSISLKTVGKKHKISLVFANPNGDYNNFLVETFLEDVKDFKTFLNDVADLTNLAGTKKIVKMFKQINEYYGGEQNFNKISDKYNLNLLFENEPRFAYNYDSLESVYKDLAVLKNKINKEKLKNIISGLIDAIN